MKMKILFLVSFATFLTHEYPLNHNFLLILDIRTGIKQKDTKKDEEKRRAATESKCTSFEEYNYILRGLVDEILMIKNIPNFKKTGKSH